MRGVIQSVTRWFATFGVVAIIEISAAGQVLADSGTIIPNPSLPTKAVPFVTPAAAPGTAGPLSGLGDDLARYGIYVRVFLDEELAANPVGGLRSGKTASQYATGGVDIDLNTLWGLQGTKIHASVITERSQGLSSTYIGGGIDVQENYAPFGITRFLELSLDQTFSLFNPNDINLVGGRIGESAYFARSDYACQFMNHVFCGSLYGFSQDTGTSLAPLATWGGKATFKPTASTYVQGGVFAIDGATLDYTTGLFNFDTSRITGENYVGEVGYETDFSNDSMPRHYRFGTWYLDAPRNDVFYNSQNLSYVLYKGTKLVHNEEGGAYFMGDQVIYRPDTTSRRNLAVFGSFLENFNDSEAVQYASKIGFVQTGTFTGRDRDTAGIAFSDTKFTANEVAYLSQMRALGGGTGIVPSHEYIIELMYGYAAAPGVTIRPNLQYIINPDSRYTPTTPKNIPDAFVVGLQITANLGDLMGLPRMPR
jgi:porin